MHNLSCENEFYLHENEKSFPYQKLSTWPRFDTEARENSKVAYSEWPLLFLSTQIVLILIFMLQFVTLFFFIYCKFFFYPVTFANNLFCLFRPCKQFTINIWGGAQSIKGFATLKNVVNLQFASEVRPEVVQDIFKKVEITQVTCLHGKTFADRNVYNDKSDYWRLLQQEWFERGRSRKW